MMPQDDEDVENSEGQRGHGALRNIEPQLEKFPMDARRAPEQVLARHAADQFLDLRVDLWTACFAHRFPTPIESPSLTMPTNDRVGLDDDE